MKTNHDVGNVAFLDTLFLFLILFICITMLLKTKQDADPSLKQNVLYQIVMQWDGELKSDMDLWAEDPQGRLVGFNRREGGEGSLFSLNRDDLGDTTELTEDGALSINEEIISLRGTFDGEYIVNGHLYNLKDNAPIKVTVKLVKIKPFSEIIQIEREFFNRGDEETFFRFKIEDRDIVETNEMPKSIIQPIE